MYACVTTGPDDGSLSPLECDMMVEIRSSVTVRRVSSTDMLRVITASFWGYVIHRTGEVGH